MQSEPTVTFKNLDSSPAIEEKVRGYIDHLEKLQPKMVSCDVVIEALQKRPVTGRQYTVHINVILPGPDVHVTRSVDHSSAEENLDLAISSAFNTAQMALQQQDAVRSTHRTKRHRPIEHGVIDRIFEGEGYGFIRAEEDQEEYYFSRESLTTDCWDGLGVGDRLKFRADDGENGPYASNVSPAPEKAD